MTDVIDPKTHDLIYQGAEARVYRTVKNGVTCICKERFSKTYRLPELDKKIRTKQFNAEKNALTKGQKHSLNLPKLLHYNPEKYLLFMSEVEGITVREYIISLGDLELENNKSKVDHIAYLIGDNISQLHHIGIVHGDLTTSNMIVPHKPEDAGEDWVPEKLTIIDLGLSFRSDLVEDRAVDLYVMERAIETTHPKTEYLLHKIYNTYKNNNLLGNKVQTRLNDVRNRGRKKSMIG